MKRIVIIVIFLLFCVQGIIKAQEERCGIETCHGIDILCGPDIPEVCTMMYALGDFCHKYARCEVVDGECRLAKEPVFEACAQCIRECTDVYQNDPLESFGCESECRQKIEAENDPAKL